MKVTTAFLTENYFVALRKVLISFAVGYCMENKLLKQSRALKPKQKKVKWSVLIADSMSDAKFKRMFRMTRECFSKLCVSIEESIGSNKFKSEVYLNDRYINDQSTNKFTRLQNANKKHCCGYISGEVKLGLTLRLLAGASYFDLEGIYKLQFQVLYNTFHYVLTNWICNDDVIVINFYNQGTDLESMKSTSNSFANGSSNGIIGKCVGVLDGLLIKMQAPSLS